MHAIAELVLQELKKKDATPNGKSGDSP